MKNAIKMFSVILLLTTVSFGQTNPETKEKVEEKTEKNWKKKKGWKDKKEWKSKKNKKDWKTSKVSADDMMKTIDTNKDGKLSEEEISKSDYTMLQYKFDYIDKDQDGFISKKELETKLSGKYGKKYKYKKG